MKENKTPLQGSTEDVVPYFGKVFVFLSDSSRWLN